MPSPEIETAAAESELIRSALDLADRAHAGQIRNGSGGMAYIHHPVAVAELLAEHGYGEETVAAALLHDVVEDSETSVEELAARFGPTIAGLVETMSDDESIDPYVRRKDEHRQRVEAAGGDALAIYAADKLSNVRVLRRAYASEGESAGEEFKAPLDVKEDIWKADLEMLRRETPTPPFVEDLASELAKLHAARARTTPSAGPASEQS
ncbi:MAG TPA: HD domain-containing protein [Solirubrobacterales bacterium]|nr:HD domain-containing protein [Solirubrobacterales bacterium]